MEQKVLAHGEVILALGPTVSRSSLHAKPFRCYTKRMHDVEPKFKVGDSVSWISQAAGISKEKRGTVLAILPAMKDAREVLKELGIEGRDVSLHAGSHSRFPRYLVDVKVSAKQKVRHVYMPLVSALNKQAKSVAFADTGLL